MTYAAKSSSARHRCEHTFLTSEPVAAAQMRLLRYHLLLRVAAGSE